MERHGWRASPCGYCLEASMTGRCGWCCFDVCSTLHLWIAGQVRNDGVGRAGDLVGWCLLVCGGVFGFGEEDGGAEG